MKRIRGKLTYANVVATLALIIAVGGASAFAATKLAPNSVGTKQIKNNAITAAKIENGAVIGAKIDLASLGPVPNAAHADSAATSERATSADSASNAVHAQSADTASSADAIAAPEAFRVVGQPGQPPFGTGWGNFGPSRPDAAFYLDREGIVHLQGEVSGDGTDALIFTLPSGYRPARQQSFPSTGSGGTFALITIDAAGEVMAGNQDITYLNGITFRAGQ